MWLQVLRLTDLRCIASAELNFAPGLNLLLGPNGAGKTSVLEALHLLSYGRSFRSGGREALVRRGQAEFTIYAEACRDDGRGTKVGLRGASGELVGRIDGNAMGRLSDLLAQLAVCSFGPESHELIAGPSSERRSFLDWGLFHVEPDFLGVWRRSQRALKQRNAALKGLASDSELDSWDSELSESGAILSRYRKQQLERLALKIHILGAELLPELGSVSLHFNPGWSGGQDAPALRATLRQRRERDRARQHTSAGPHRADWSIHFEHAPEHEHLSRGQEKLTALVCVLAQARLYRDSHAEWPIICMDDLCAELDRAHQQKVMQALLGEGAQVLITGTEAPPWIDSFPFMVFHVEQGTFSQVQK